MVSSLVFLAALFGVSEGRLRYGRRDLESSDKLHVLISLNNDPSTFTSSLAHSISYGAGLTRVNAVSAVVSKEDYNSLMDHPDVKSVELDEMLYPDSFGETFPYGIAMTQGVDPSMGTKAASTSDDSACSSPSSFKVAIIDSGLEVAHPDVTCRSIDDEDTNCVGMSFVEGGNEKWYAPQSTHGTHVYGTIGASRSNNQGVSGMLTDDNVCFLIGQVFGKDGGARTSTIMNAVEWAVNQGAKVINMSLGGGSPSNIAKSYYAKIRKQGVLVIGAAGNDGTSDLHYPASYSSVISVAAVDSSMARASFSQNNEEVDIAAPGAGVLSIVPRGLGSIAVVAVNDQDFQSSFMQNSNLPSTDGVSGYLVNCPKYGTVPCEGTGNHVCLIQRGETTFEDKALNCELGGGKAAIIYNHSPGVIAGTLSDPTKSVIPVVGVSQEVGELLIASYLGQKVNLTSVDGYAFMDGTSMATPHVTGGVAEIWRSCPACSNEHVASCILSTALDLGSEGRDNEFGHGLLQTSDALKCLIEDGCC